MTAIRSFIRNHSIACFAVALALTVATGGLALPLMFMCDPD